MRVDLRTYVVISIWFGCNNSCSICMLSRVKPKLQGIGFYGFQEVVSGIARRGRFKNLILSGAEVTTFPELGRYVAFAASLGWFDKIQVQTNGRKLGDKEYLRRLIGSGVNEFFVSVQGLEASHDAATGVRGSHKETMAGLRNLGSFDVNVISNTVLTKGNFPDIHRLMSVLAEERVSEMHMWNLFPMEKADTRDLVVSLNDFVRLLPDLACSATSSGKAIVLKGFPLCLSVGEPIFFDNLFPATVLPELFWKEFDECGFGTCVHKEHCRASQCWGLSNAYVQKYGDERKLLSPIR